MTEKTDGEKKLVTIGTIITLLLVAIIISIIIQIPYHYITGANIKECFEFTETLFRTIVLTEIGILGLNIVSTRKQFSKFYKKGYGQKKLNYIMKPLIEEFTGQEKYEAVINYINELIKKDEYFNKVYILQDLDFDFVKLWNDFNYYQQSINSKNKKYWFDLKKCIYIKLYKQFCETKE